MRPARIQTAAFLLAALPVLAACAAKPAADTASSATVVAAGPVTPLKPDEARRRLLDACVIEISDRPQFSGMRESSVSICQCAAAKAAPLVDPADVARISYGQLLTGGVRDVVYEAIASCSN